MSVREELGQVFDEIDADKSGSLDKKEIKTAVEKGGYKISDDEIKGIFAELDESGDGKISRDEFIKGMEEALDPKKHQEAILRRAFAHFDKDGSGTIDRNELAQVFEELGEKIPADELKRLMDILDKDKSGSVNYEEFFAAFSE